MIIYAVKQINAAITSKNNKAEISVKKTEKKKKKREKRCGELKKN